MGYQKWSGWDLQVDRTAFWMKDPDNADEYVQRAEIVTHFWTPRAGRQERAAHPVPGGGGEEIDNGQDDGGMLDGQYHNAEGHNADSRRLVGGLVGVERRNLGPFGEERDIDVFEMPDYAR
jgi:hypothetical protein